MVLFKDFLGPISPTLFLSTFTTLVYLFTYNRLWRIMVYVISLEELRVWIVVMKSSLRTAFWGIPWAIDWSLGKTVCSSVFRLVESDTWNEEHLTNPRWFKALSTACNFEPVRSTSLSLKARSIALKEVIDDHWWSFMWGLEVTGYLRKGPM